MGYTLKIGQLEKVVDEDYSFDTAESVRLDNAPAFGEPTDYTNSRWPSYTSWHNFSRFVNLEDLFYNKETGLIRQHPGCFKLTQEHKEIIDKAYSDFYQKYPNCKPGYSPNIDEKNGIYEDKSWSEEKSWAVRLEWLKFWVDWSLENCSEPVFYNS
jgi:hypothetical protein